jgi:hypothetical protein
MKDDESSVYAVYKKPPLRVSNLDLMLEKQQENLMNEIDKKIINAIKLYEQENIT